MNESNTIVIKTMNHQTGEMFEKEITGPDSAVIALLELTASKKAIEQAEKQIKDYLENWLGDDEKSPAGGKMVVRKQMERRTWRPEVLRELGLDDDAIETISVINMTRAKELVDEMIERGDIVPNAKKILAEKADVSTSKPFIQVL